MRLLKLSSITLAVCTGVIFLTNTSKVMGAPLDIENIVWADDCSGDRNVRKWYSINGNTTLISLFKGSLSLRLNVKKSQQQGDLYSFTYGDVTSEQYKKVDDSTIVLQSRVLDGEKRFEGGANVKTGVPAVPVKLCNSNSYASKAIEGVVDNFLASENTQPTAIQLSQCSIIFTRATARFLGAGDLKSSQSASDLNKKIDKLGAATYGNMDRFISTTRDLAPQYNQWLKSQPESVETQALKDCIAATKSK